MGYAVTIASIIIASGALWCWAAVRRCPLARAIGCQINQVAASSR